MVIDIEVLTKWLAFFAEICAIVGGIYAYIRIKIIGRIETAEKKIKALEEDKDNFWEELETDKEERIIIVKALSACLDGLSQLGANHSVPESKKELDDFLLKKSHK